MPRSCITHHFACNCREDKIKELRDSIRSFVDQNEKSAMHPAHFLLGWNAMVRALSEVEELYPKEEK